jgi:hypothetical protein
LLADGARIGDQLPRVLRDGLLDHRRIADVHVDAVCDQLGDRIAGPPIDDDVFVGTALANELFAGGPGLDPDSR